MGIKMHVRIAQALGIGWTGAVRDGEAYGDIKKSDADLLRLVCGLPQDEEEFGGLDLVQDAASQKLKAKLSADQWQTVQAIQQEIKDTSEDKILLDLAKAFFKTAFQLGEAGQSLTAANLKPWRDKVKAALTK